MRKRLACLLLLSCWVWLGLDFGQSATAVEPNLANLEVNPDSELGQEYWNTINDDPIQDTTYIDVDVDLGDHVFYRAQGVYSDTLLSSFTPEIEFIVGAPIAPEGLSVSIPESVRRSPPCEYAWALEIDGASFEKE